MLSFHKALLIQKDEGDKNGAVLCERVCRGMGVEGGKVPISSTISDAS